MMKLYTVKFSLNSLKAFLSFDSSVNIAANDENDAKEKAKNLLKKAGLWEDNYISIISSTKA